MTKAPKCEIHGQMFEQIFFPSSMAKHAKKKSNKTLKSYIKIFFRLIFSVKIKVLPKNEKDKVLNINMRCLW